MSVWFDYTTYLNNKVAELQKNDKAGGWTLLKVMQAFAEAGFGGETGAEQHFVQFGQDEDVAPNAFFNPMEYYRAKAAEVYNKQNAPLTVTEVEVNDVMLAIKGLKMGAWSHYKAFGSAEGINPSNLFDTDAYITAKTAALNDARPDGQPEFTPEIVKAAIQSLGISALEHFMMFGGDATKGEVPFEYTGTIPSEFAVKPEKQVKPDNSRAGNSFSLTADGDIINDTTNTTGKPTATTFAGDLDDTFVAGVADSLNAGDNLDGAGGQNTLRIVGSAAGSDKLGSVTLANVQTVELTGAVTAISTAIIDASMHKGVVKDVVLNNITTSGANNAIFAADISQTVTLSGKLHNISDGKGFVIKYEGLSSTADDSALLKLNGLTITDGDSSGAPSDALVIAGVENITLNLTGANDFAELDAGALKTLTLTGPGTAEGIVDASSATITSINASAAGGAELTVDAADLATAGFTYTGSKNMDALTISGDSSGVKLIIDLGDGDNELTYTAASSGIAAGTTFKAGAGLNDTLTLDGSAASNVTSTVANAFSGFEMLSVAGAGLSGLDVSMFKGITSVEIAADAGVVGLSAEQAKDILVNFGTSSEASVAVATKTFALKDATGTNDSIGFTLEHATLDTGVVNLTGATLTGFENLTVQAASGAKEILVSGQTAGSNYTQVTLAAAADLKTVKLTGDRVLAFNTTSAAKLALIDARENTAGVDITLAATTLAQEVFGSDKMDKFDITGPTGNGSLTLKAGGGNDTVTVAFADMATGKIILDGGTGLNTLKFGDSATATTVPYTINDTDFANVSNFGAIEITGKHAGITNVTLGASAAALAASNNGVLKFAADLGASVQANDSISFRSTAMAASAAVDLSLKNTGDSNVSIATGGGNDKIALTVASGGSATVIAVDGGAGNDIITVTADSASSITINGGAGNDTITGSAVADIIIGGAGADIMTGDTGEDIFRYEAAGESNGANIDWIKDFAAGGAGDKIDLKIGSDVLKGVTIGSATAVDATLLKSSITITSAADLADLQAQLTDSAAVKAAYTGSATTAGANQIKAGLIVVTSGAFAGTYMMINDSTAGYLAADDILINVTGITGTLAAGDFTFSA